MLRWQNTLERQQNKGIGNKIAQYYEEILELRSRRSEVTLCFCLKPDE